MSERGSFAPHVPCSCERCARLHGDQAYEEDREEFGAWFTVAQMRTLRSALTKMSSSRVMLSTNELALVQKVLG